MIRMLVADPHRDDADWVQVLSDQADFHVTVTGNGEEAIDTLRRQPIDVVLIASILPDMNGPKLASLVKKLHPELSVFVVARESTVRLWREVSLCKAHLLPIPIDLDRLRYILNTQETEKRSQKVEEEQRETVVKQAAKPEEPEPKEESISSGKTIHVEARKQETPVQRMEPKGNIRARPSRKNHRQEKEGGRVILVYSWKGGVGKTTTAVNLAAVLQTYAHLSVGLIELTRQTGNILSHFPLMPTVTVKHWVESMPEESEVFSMMLEDPATGIYLLPSPTLLDHIASPYEITISDARKMLNLLRRVFEVVVVDAGTLLDEFQFSMFEASDVVLLLSDLSFETLKENHYMPEILRRRDIELEKVIHVVNKVDKGLGITVKDAMDIVAVPNVHAIHFRKELIKKKEKREPFVLTHPKDLYTDEMQALAAMIFPDNEKLAVKPSWWKKMMQKVAGGNGLL